MSDRLARAIQEFCACKEEKSKEIVNDIIEHHSVNWWELRYKLLFSVLVVTSRGKILAVIGYEGSNLSVIMSCAG